MSPLSPNQRLEKIAAFVETRLKAVAASQTDERPNPDYRWQHILRVCNYGKLLAEAEGANVELVLAGCLLHDVAVFDPGDSRDHGRRGAEIARALLGELGYTPEEVENICYSVASHVDVDKPHTLEARVVTDADNIDRFGAYRAITWCLRDMDDYDRLITNLIARLQTLKTYRQQHLLETEMGNRLFDEQLDFQIQFFEALVKENDWTLLPKL